MKKINALRSEVLKMPQIPGVYIFLDDKGSKLYIGKAKNLKNRVYSYFSNKLYQKTANMVAQARQIAYIPVDSEFEALLLEAKLVRKHKPKYNSELRDDKSPLYIAITDEFYPRIITLRGTQLEYIKTKRVFGPFTNSRAPKQVLSMLRKVFTFSTHKPGARACVYSQINLCVPCPSVVEGHKDNVEIYTKLRVDYLSNVRRVSSILSGKSKFVVKELEKRMFALAKKEDFESASDIKQKIDVLRYILQRPSSGADYIQNPNLLDDIRGAELRDLSVIVSNYYDIGELHRIECYDVAHLSSSSPTASMVTFVNGEPDKSFYRHFKISEKSFNDDTARMKNVLERRSKHFADWGIPELIIVDGGKAQVSAAISAGIKVPVVGLAKKRETLVFRSGSDFVEYILPERPAKKLVQRMRDEAHRFARRLHHKTITRALIGNAKTTSVK